jgi:hypothetical protein
MRPLSTFTTVPLPPKPRFGLAALSTLIAIAALVVERIGSGAAPNSLTHKLPSHVWAGSMAGVFLIFGSIAVRRVATQVGRLVHVGGGPTAGAALRLILTIVGLIFVIIITIGLLGVNPTQLLAAAGITGVILGLAAQQSLGNVFAGIVLMVARPFSVGQRIRIRSGAFGGIFDAEVRGMGLTYVELMTDDGPLKLPNLGMLAAAVGPAPEPVKDPDAKTLYVDRSLDKRPPRVAPPHGSRRQHREPTVRRPRDIILRTRKRRDKGRGHPSEGAGEPGTPEGPEDG